MDPLFAVVIAIAFAGFSVALSLFSISTRIADLTGALRTFNYDTNTSSDVLKHSVTLELQHLGDIIEDK